MLDRLIVSVGQKMEKKWWFADRTDDYTEQTSKHTIGNKKQYNQSVCLGFGFFFARVVSSLSLYIIVCEVLLSFSLSICLVMKDESMFDDSNL